MKLSLEVGRVLHALIDIGGNPFVVGGTVRDFVLGRMRGTGVIPKDVDIEVFGLSGPQVMTVLERFGIVSVAGNAFGVLKMRLADGSDIDVSLPRRENSIGKGHKDFLVESDLMMSPREAAKRRDFSMNAMMWQFSTGEMFDFFGGEEALRRGILIHINDEAFVEDPLRVARAAQFVGRFSLDAHPRTVALCQRIVDTFDTLPKERVREEWMKWAEKSVEPSRGLRFLRGCGWMVHFPELGDLVGCPQDPKWHPEGDAFEHTCHAVDAAARIATEHELDDRDQSVLVFGTLCHDVGKPTTTHEHDGRWVSPGHAEAGVPIAERFMERFDAFSWLTAQVVPLVREHMCYISWREQMPSDRMILRLARSVSPASMRNLVFLAEADVSGHPPLKGSSPMRDALIRAAELDVEAKKPKPILTGKHLVESEFGFCLKPGPRVGEILRAAEEAQLDQEFSDEPGALAWAREFVQL